MVVLGAQDDNFKRSMQDGRKAELYIKKLFENKGYFVKLNDSDALKELSEWDLCISTLKNKFFIEVKNDLLSRKTQNIGFEIAVKDSEKPSSLLSTKSDYWCHVFYTSECVKIAFCKVPALRYFLVTNYIKNKEAQMRLANNSGDAFADIVLCDIDSFEKNMPCRIWDVTYEEAEKEGLI